MDWIGIFSMFDGFARIATVGLIVGAIGAIVIFLRVFNADFNGPE
jgi:hypothetical protein